MDLPIPTCKHFLTKQYVLVLVRSELIAMNYSQNTQRIPLIILE